MPKGPLLAKRPVDGNEMTLLEHSKKVLDSAGFIFGEPGQPTRLSQQWLRFFKLPEDSFPSFIRNLRLAAIFHDIGKANDGFQKAVSGKGKQMIRHEHLSALFLLLDPVRQWLRNHATDGVDTNLVLSAVVSHHLKVTHETFASQLQPVDVPCFTVYSDAPEFREVLKLAAGELNDSAPDTSRYAGSWRFDQQVALLEKEFKRTMRSFKANLRENEARQRLLLAVRAGLIVADSAGSAILRMDRPLREWTNLAFGNAPLTAQDIENRVIAPRIEDLKQKKKWTDFHDFQKEAAGLGPRALLLSGCGTGKTLAAWKWIQAQLAIRPASRVLFLYPTRATSTEGFRDYVSWAEEEAALLHGTASYDLDGMFDNPEDPRHGGDYTVLPRLFALSYWHKRIFSATVDSFLAVMANRYGPICLLPLLADSVVVFDEVHSFDRSMFTALERFLKFFDVPVLCMTASLPSDRREVLRDGCGLEIFPKDPSVFADLLKQSKTPRYRVRKTQPTKICSIVETAVRNRKRVLWVLNTVRRCQAAAQSLSGVVPDSQILCYHSRFKLVDRKKRHDEVLQQFRSEQGGPLVAVTTQVCEMSLDLDADVLITEVAPVPSLVQRMGRCCREPIPRDGRIGLVYAYYPEDERPYAKVEVKQGLQFIEQMAKRKTVSHSDLAKYLQQMDVIDPFIEEGFAPFLDSGWYAEAREGEFREGDEFCVDGVLDGDVEHYLDLKKKGESAAIGLILPVPRKHASENPRLGRYLYQAPESHYCPQYGFLEEGARNDP